MLHIVLDKLNQVPNLLVPYVEGNTLIWKSKQELLNNIGSEPYHYLICTIESDNFLYFFYKGFKETPFSVDGVYYVYSEVWGLTLHIDSPLTTELITKLQHFQEEL